MTETIRLNEEEIIEKFLPGGFLVNNVLFTHPLTPDTLEGATNFKFRSNDIVLATYPKSGTTWTTEILSWLLNIDNQDYCKNEPQLERALYLEFIYQNNDVPNYKRLTQIPVEKQRLIKTHLSPSFLDASIFENRPKIIYVYRNPFDTAVSFYHFYQTNKYINKNFKHEISWEEFFEMFKNGYATYGDWFDTMIEWWNKKNEPNVLFIEYELMKANPIEEVQNIVKFLQLDYTVTQEYIEHVVRQSSFSIMKENKTIMPLFLRKGIVGDWLNYFNDEQKDFILEKFKRKLKPLGITVKYCDLEFIDKIK